MIFLTFRGLFTGWHQVTVSAHHQGPPDAEACQGNSKISSHHRPHCCTKGTNHIAMPVMMTATNFTDVLPHPHLVRTYLTLMNLSRTGTNENWTVHRYSFGENVPSNH